MELSSLMSLVAIREMPQRARWLSGVVRTGSRATGEMLTRGLLDHYRTTLADIHSTGYWRFLLREFQPYLAGAARQFSREQTSVTERLLARTRRK
jgi:hypothetical protein